MYSLSQPKKNKIKKYIPTKTQISSLFKTHLKGRVGLFNDQSEAIPLENCGHDFLAIFRKMVILFMVYFAILLFISVHQ